MLLIVKVINRGSNAKHNLHRMMTRRVHGQDTHLEGAYVSRKGDIVLHFFQVQ